MSAMSGTTRDAIDTQVVLPGGRAFTLIDTAGIRKRAAVADSPDGAEPLSVNRALAAIRCGPLLAPCMRASQEGRPWQCCMERKVSTCRTAGVENPWKNACCRRAEVVALVLDAAECADTGTGRFTVTQQARARMRAHACPCPSHPTMKAQQQ